MTRNFLLTLTAALPLVTACSDDGGGGTTEGATTGGGTTMSMTTSGGTTTDTPTTSGEPMTTTGMSGTGDTTDGPATTEMPTTTGEPATTTGPDLTTTTDVTATTGGDTGTGTGNETGGDPVQQCIMMLEDPNDACGQCVCTNCNEELQDCQEDEGCTAIRECAQEAMCSGIDCLGPCGDTIDMYGGLGGPSAQKGLALGMCVENSCSMECGG